MCIQHQHVHTGVCAQRQRAHTDVGGLARVHEQLLTQVCTMLRWVCPHKPRCVATGRLEAGVQGRTGCVRATLGCGSSQPMRVKVSIQGQQPFYLWRGMVCLVQGMGRKSCAGVGGGEIPQGRRCCQPEAEEWTEGPGRLHPGTSPGVSGEAEPTGTSFPP